MLQKTKVEALNAEIVELIKIYDTLRCLNEDKILISVLDSETIKISQKQAIDLIIVLVNEKRKKVDELLKTQNEDVPFV